MLRSIGFIPKMGLVQNLSFGLKGRMSLASNPITDSGFYLILGSLFGFLFLLRNWYGRFRFLGFLHDKSLYNACVISTLLILGLSVRRLSRSCDQFQRSLSLIWGKLTQIRNGLGSSGGLCTCCGSKIQSLKLKGCKSSEKERENEVIKLREKLRRERKKRKEAILDLKIEREASAWASEEAMAKIMLLQSEKASIEREARQYREIMEQKQLYDEEVIEYLKLVVQSISTERGGELPSASRFVQSGDYEPWALRFDGE